MVFGDCMPEPDSVTQKVMLIGISTPDWSSSALARSGSYGYWLTWSVYAQPIAGGMGPTDGVPVPLRMSEVKASLLIAKLTARRTRTLSNGGFLVLSV